MSLNQFKFLAREHQLTLTVLTAWFVAETKLDWIIDQPHDPALVVHPSITAPALVNRASNVTQLVWSLKYDIGVLYR